MSSFFNDRIAHQSRSLYAFSGNGIERWTEAREGLDFTAALKSESASVYLLVEDRALIHVNGERLSARFAPDRAQALGLSAASLILLGVAGDDPRFAGIVPA